MKNFKNIKNIVGVFALSAIIVSCDVDNTLDEIVEPEIVYATATSGSADFSNFISLGNSLTHGVVSGTVFIASQENSFPNIMANQMKAMGGGEFIQPLVNDNIGGLLYGGQVLSGPRLYFDAEIGAPAFLDETPTTEVTKKISGPFNNFGVGGAKSFHLIAPGYGSVPGVLAGTANPYFAMMSSSETASVLEDAVATNPTFFSLWIGNNDVLGYATSGGDGSNPITDTPTFNFAMTTLVETLTANDAKGIIANIPNVTAIPFFTSVSYNPVPLDAATAGQLNAGYAAYNGGLQAAFQALAGTGLFTQEELDRRTINFVEGNNAVVILDEYLTDLGAINPAFAGLPQFRQTTSTDLITLTTASILPSGAGTATPLSDSNVLTPEEQEEILQATTIFNATIASLASQKGLALYDANATFEAMANGGIQFDEYLVNSSLVFGGAVSLDGIHPTSRGYALAAKQMLMQIDATYGSNFEASGNVPKADDFTTNFSPALK
jgi:hypothetical protein